MKDLNPEYAKNSKISTVKKKYLTRKLAKKTVNRHFTEGDIQMTNKHRKRCSKSLAIREMQNVKNFIEHIRKAKITKKNDNTKCWRG